MPGFVVEETGRLLEVSEKAVKQRSESESEFDLDGMDVRFPEDERAECAAWIERGHVRFRLATSQPEWGTPSFDS
jgi:hypothetical protein